MSLCHRLVVLAWLQQYGTDCDAAYTTESILDVQPEKSRGCDVVELGVTRYRGIHACSYIWECVLA